jgi:hypothetical protein
VADHYNPDFVFCCGSDTYLNTDLLLRVLEWFDPHDKLYIGGHSEYRKVNNENILYHTGGGFLVSNGFLTEIKPLLLDMTKNWIKLCYTHSVGYLVPCCDVCIGYHASHLDCHVITLNQMFTGCDYQAQQCRDAYGLQSHSPNLPHQLVSCHYMTPERMREYNTLLQKQGYFTDQPIYKHDMTPNCTLITTCFNGESLSPLLISTPCYQVVFCDAKTMDIIRKPRCSLGLDSMTIYYVLPHQPPPQFKLMLKAAKMNPFTTDHFCWIQHEIDGSQRDLLQLMKQDATDTFHLRMTSLGVMDNSIIFFGKQESGCDFLSGTPRYDLCQVTYGLPTRNLREYFQSSGLSWIFEHVLSHGNNNERCLCIRNIIRDLKRLNIVANGQEIIQLLGIYHDLAPVKEEIIDEIREIIMSRPDVKQAYHIQKGLGKEMPFCL